MQSECIFTQEQNTRQVWKFPGTPMDRSQPSAFAGQLAQALGQGHPGIQRTSDDQDGIVTGNGTEHFWKLFLVDRLRDGLGPAGYGMQDDELADPVQPLEQLR